MKRSTVPCSIAARFSAAANTYDSHSQVQRTVALRLMNSLPKTPEFDPILEVGCGTGTLTEHLSLRFPGSLLEVVDASGAMIETARRRLKNSDRILWHVADARQFDVGRLYSLIVGSSSLHWMVPVSGTIRHFAGLLKPGGRLVCSLMVNGTFEELHKARLHLFPQKAVRVRLPLPEEVTEAVKAAGLRILSSGTQRMEAGFDSAAAFLRSLHQQGVTGAVDGGGPLLNRTELRRIVERYDRDYSHPAGGVFATFRVLRFQAVKGK